MYKKQVSQLEKIQQQLTPYISESIPRIFDPLKKRFLKISPVLIQAERMLQEQFPIEAIQCTPDQINKFFFAFIDHHLASVSGIKDQLTDKNVAIIHAEIRSGLEQCQVTLSSNDQTRTISFYTLLSLYQKNYLAAVAKDADATQEKAQYTANPSEQITAKKISEMKINPLFFDTVRALRSTLPESISIKSLSDSYTKEHPEHVITSFFKNLQLLYLLHQTIFKAYPQETKLYRASIDATNTTALDAFQSLLEKTNIAPENRKKLIFVFTQLQKTFPDYLGIIDNPAYMRLVICSRIHELLELIHSDSSEEAIAQHYLELRALISSRASQENLDQLIQARLLVLICKDPKNSDHITYNFKIIKDILFLAQNAWTPLALGTCLHLLNQPEYLEVLRTNCLSTTQEKNIRKAYQTLCLHLTYNLKALLMGIPQTMSLPPEEKPLFITLLTTYKKLLKLLLVDINFLELDKNSIDILKDKTGSSISQVGYGPFTLIRKQNEEYLEGKNAVIERISQSLFNEPYDKIYYRGFDKDFFTWLKTNEVFLRAKKIAENIPTETISALEEV